MKGILKVKENKKVIICMSTYNGEKYVKEQIESLLNQTYKNIEIYIRDDGSKDGTIQILEDYETQGKIHFIKGENVGVVNSFYECLKEAYEKGEIFAYCDQDDKWHEDKIERAVKALNNDEQDIPLLYFSEFNYCDENLKFLNKSNVNKKGASFENSIVECISFGISEVFNKKLAQKILETDTDEICFHDWWAYMIAAGMGKVLYDNEATVEYRRTGSNVSPSGKGKLELQIYRVKKFLLGKYFNNIREQTNKFKIQFENELDAKNKKVINLFSLKYNFVKSIKKTFYPKMFRQNVFDEILCRVLFLFGRL